VFTGETMSTQALLMEMLISGFFAIACFRARAGEFDLHGLTPRAVFGLIDRIERLRRTRWQWCTIVLLLVIVRTQKGTPFLAELTALVLFVLFLALPVADSPGKEMLHKR
jgi:hypothetical protein